MNKRNTLVNVANATFIQNELASPNLLLDSVTAALAGFDNRKDECLQVLASIERGKFANDFEQLKFVGFNSQGFVDCYQQMVSFDFYKNFRAVLSAKTGKNITKWNDLMVCEGMFEIGELFAEDCQAMLPEIVSKYSGLFNTGRGDDNKQLVLATYAMTHRQFIRSGLHSVASDQFGYYVKNQPIQRFNTEEEAMQSVYEIIGKFRLYQLNRQVSSNIMAYCFLVANNIVCSKFSKTFKNEGPWRYIKTSETFNTLVQNEVKNPIKTCAERICENRFHLVANNFLELTSVSVKRKWSQQELNAATNVMLEIACKFLQKHMDNLNSNKYVDNIVEKLANDEYTT